MYAVWWAPWWTGISFKRYENQRQNCPSYSQTFSTLPWAWTAYRRWTWKPVSFPIWSYYTFSTLLNHFPAKHFLSWLLFFHMSMQTIFLSLALESKNYLKKIKEIGAAIFKRVLSRWLMYTQLVPSFPSSPLPPLLALPVAPSFLHEVWHEGFIGSNRLGEHDSLIAHLNPFPPKLPRPPEEKIKVKLRWSRKYYFRNLIRKYSDCGKTNDPVNSRNRIHPSFHQ